MEKYRIAVGIPTLKDCSLEAIACSELIIGDGAIISLPSSYNQRRTVMLNYEVLANIYKSRKGHKLDEWNQLCGWIEGLPYSEIVTGIDPVEVEKDHA